MKKFLRRDSARYVSLGKLRKKKQKWRKPTGRDNKMREKRKGYPKVVSIGHKKEKQNLNVKLVKNINDLKDAKGKIILIGKIGRRKKMEIAKQAKEMKMDVENLNIKKFIRKFTKKSEEKKK